MLRQIVLHDRAYHISLQIVVAGPAEGVFCQGGRESKATQLRRDLRVNEAEDVPVDAVFKVGDLAIALDLKASGSYVLWCLSLIAKNPPRHQSSSNRETGGESGILSRQRTTASL